MAVFNVFKDGNLVTASGVYSALHSTPHKLWSAQPMSKVSGLSHAAYALWG